MIWHMVKEKNSTQKNDDLNERPTVGIIGFGSFGKFAAGILEKHATIKTWDITNKPAKFSASQKEVVTCDYLIFAIPLSAYTDVIGRIKQYLQKETTIIDVCSVKHKPATMLAGLLNEQPIVLTHPLFGPESASQSLSGHTIVICPDSSTKSKVEEVSKFCKSLGLNVIMMSPKEHDQEMAIVQGLTFYVARCLERLPQLRNTTLKTPSFNKLLDLANLESHHSEDLFYTIQSGNLFAEKVRQNFIEQLQEINRDISSHGV